MSKTKVSVGETLRLKSSLKKRSSFMYNVFNDRKVSKLLEINSVKDAKKIDEDLVSKFIVEGPFKIIFIEGRFGETFISYNKISKYIK